MNIEDDFMWVAGNAFSEMRLMVEGAIIMFEEDASVLCSLARDAEKHEALSMAIAQLSNHTGTHARWIVKRMAGERIVLQCSACQNYENDSAVRGKYCWNCGAKMDD